MLHNSAIPHTDVIPARRRLLAYHSLLCLKRGEPSNALEGQSD